MTMTPSHEVLVGRRRALGAVLLGALIGVALLAVAPQPSNAWPALRHPAGSVDPTAPLLALIGLAAWTLAAYLVTGVLVTAAGRIPGLLGRLCAALAARTVPAAVRRTVGVALGAGLILGPAVPAQAVPGVPGAQGPGVVAASTSLDWPAVDAPAGTPAPLAAPTATPAAVVLVRPGDTLWALAERSLRSQGRAPTAAAVAAAWPSWWAANREAVGDDPDLLHPGTSLAPPS